MTRLQMINEMITAGGRTMTEQIKNASDRKPASYVKKCYQSFKKDKEHWFFYAQLSTGLIFLTGKGLEDNCSKHV